MAKYVTKQRTLLTEYFHRHLDEAVTARQIAADLEAENISLSAVYRNLSSMEKEGLVHRVNHGDSKEAYYRYAAAEECQECLHLSCKECGKTFHLSHDGAERIMRTLSDTVNFSLDKQDTILYGVCERCKK